MIKFLQGNCIDKIKELDDNSIDCVVSSPPYFGLRDYGVDGQFGLEKTYQDYLTNTVKVFETFKPKLKDTATIWWNVGDSYSSGKRTSTTNQSLRGNKDYGVTRTPVQQGIKEKDLLMIPNRVAIALQDAGWYIRSEIIWHKPNPMPESVRDRPTSCHEKIWLITKSKKYYYDADAIREPVAKGTITRLSEKNLKNQKGSNRGNGGMRSNGNMKPVGNMETKNKRNVWTVTTKPCKEAHFATFPKDLIEPCIKAGCPEKVCVKCGTPYVRNLKIIFTPERKTRDNMVNVIPGRDKPTRMNSKNMESLIKKDLGFKKDCNCKTDEFKSGVVLDPFGGSGTTGIVASLNNRNAILIELNKEYISIANKRINKEFGFFNT
jgi:DNA modification methylase